MKRTLNVHNVVDRIRAKLATIEPVMRFEYDNHEKQYWLVPADGSMQHGPFKLDELLGLLRYLGPIRRAERDDERVMLLGRPGGANFKGWDQPYVTEKPLSKHKHFKWISKLEACARLKLAKDVAPAFDYRGLLDDTKLEAPEAPQGATGEPAELPEPDEDFLLPAAELGSV